MPDGFEWSRIRRSVIVVSKDGGGEQHANLGAATGLTPKK